MKRKNGNSLWLIVGVVLAVFSCCAAFPTPMTGAETTVYAVHTSVDSCSDTVAVMPAFPGGDTAMLKWVGEHLRYPYSCEGPQGRVVVQFLIAKDGSIGEVKVIRSVTPELDAEVVRVVKTFPKFTPGKINGVITELWYTLPITFKLGTESNSPTTQNTDKL